MKAMADIIIAMAYGTTCSTLMNSFAAILCDFFANLENPNSLNLYSHLQDPVSNIDMHMLGKMQCGPLHLYFSIRKA